MFWFYFSEFSNRSKHSAYAQIRSVDKRRLTPLRYRLYYRLINGIPTYGILGIMISTGTGPVHKLLVHMTLSRILVESYRIPRLR